jgi:hypothetical protein
VAGGCHLNRPIEELVQRAGFETIRLHTSYIEEPRPMTFTYGGCARPARASLSLDKCKVARRAAEIVSSPTPLLVSDVSLASITRNAATQRRLVILPARCDCATMKDSMAMTEGEKDKATAAAVAGVGAGVGTAGGATVGVLELAARGVATGFSAGLVIGVGAAAGAGLAYGIYRFFKKRKS